MPTAATTITIRERVDADLPRLAQVLAQQQPMTHYPLSWSRSDPIESFIRRPGAEQAWVAEIGDELVGHVLVGHVDEGLADLFAAATGRTDLATVGVLFVADTARGTGIGARLLETAVERIRRDGRLPVLDVVPTHGAAPALYRHRGWVEVGRIRPDWLPADGPDVVLMALPERPRAPRWD